MLNVAVDGKIYQCIENWEEMSIGQAIDLLPVLYSLPKSMQEIYSYAFDENGAAKQAAVEITDEELIKEIPEAYGRIIAKMTNIPQNVIDSISAESRTIFYNEYLLPFAIGLMIAPYNYTEKNIKQFTFENVDYIFPLFEKDVNGNLRPAIDMKAIEFTEAADLQLAAARVEDGKFEYVTHVIAIMCKPANELYSEKVILERAEKFKQLPVTVAFEVFFCLIKYSIILKKIFPMLSAAEGSQLKVVR